MTITLQDIAAKKIKSNSDFSISDHTITFLRPTDLVITGKGTRGLVFKNAIDCNVYFKDAVIDNASNGVIIKFDGRTQRLTLDGTGSKLFGKAGNEASQCIYVVGDWNDVEICGFEIDQRRDNRTGPSTTGSCVQLQGVIKSGSLGDVYLHDMILRNCGDEGTYVNHFDLVGGYATGENLNVDNVKVYGSGRDYNQQRGFRRARYSNCYGENGMKESDSNHWSALSMNGDTEELLIENCEFKNIAQLIYSGAPTEEKVIEAIIRNVKFTEGVHLGPHPNSSAYLKGPGKYRFENCVIDAPNVLKGAISADGSEVTLVGCSTNAKDIDVLYNGGKVIVGKPDPVIKKFQETVTRIETTPYNEKTQVQFFRDSGEELIVKQ